MSDTSPWITTDEPCPSGHTDCTVDCGSCKGTGRKVTGRTLTPGDGHAPRPGPLHWDWRCLRCDGLVDAHLPWWRRLMRRLPLRATTGRRATAAHAQAEDHMTGRSLSSTEEAAMSGDSHNAVPCEQFVGFDGECCGRCGFGAWQHNKVSS